MMQQVSTLGNVFFITMIIFGIICTLFVLGFVVAMCLRNNRNKYKYSGYVGDIYNLEKYQMSLDISLKTNPKERIRIQIADISPYSEYTYLATYLSDDEAKELIDILQRHLYEN